MTYGLYEYNAELSLFCAKYTLLTTPFARLSYPHHRYLSSLHFFFLIGTVMFVMDSLKYLFLFLPEVDRLSSASYPQRYNSLLVATVYCKEQKDF